MIILDTLLHDEKSPRQGRGLKIVVLKIDSYSSVVSISAVFALALPLSFIVPRTQAALPVGGDILEVAHPGQLGAMIPYLDHLAHRCPPLDLISV